MKDKVLEYWNKLDKNAKLFACGVVIILLVGIIWS
jgi:hypothetical protein